MTRPPISTEDPSYRKRVTMLDTHMAYVDVAEGVTRIVDSYARWLAKCPIPKLFIDADPAGFLIGAQREFCRAWPNQQVVTVKGSHFVQEESPGEVGEATARFVAKVRAGQIGER